MRIGIATSDCANGIFELTSNFWDPVTDVECTGFDVHFISTE